VLFATETVLAVLRWSHDWHLFLIGCVAFGLGAAGWWVRRRRWRNWLLWHGMVMPGSYIALLTGSTSTTARNCRCGTGFRTGVSGFCPRRSASG
jgi:hypothetical protein